MSLRVGGVRMQTGDWLGQEEKRLLNRKGRHNYLGPGGTEARLFD